MAVDGSLRFDTKVDTTGFAKGTNTIVGQANGLKKSLAGIGKMVVAAFGVAQLIKFGKQAIETASDLQEVQNVVDTAFGSMAYKMEEFADKSIEAFGISKLAAKQTGSTFMAMGTGMGLATDTASDMAIALTGLSADMASFYNVNQDIASTALKSIFTGETETLKQFGVVMTEANLQAFALSEGIKKSVSNMSQAEKVQLRYAFVMKQTAIAQGDFAKTSGSWANQTRMLSEKWKELLGIIGNGLVQVLTPVIHYLNIGLTYLTKFATQVGSILASVFGLENAMSDTAGSANKIASGSADASAGLNDLGESAEEAAKKVNGTAGFDKLNNMTESIAENSSGAADALMSMGGVNTAVSATVGPADTSALENSLSASMDRIKGAMTMFNSWITTSFVPIFKSIWTGLQPHIENFKTIASGIWTDIQSLWQPFLDFVGGSFTPLLQQYFTTMGGIVTGLFDTFNTVFSDIWNLAVFPILQSFITTALPMLASFGTEFYSLFLVVFNEVKAIFDMLWNDVAAPALAFFAKVWTDLATIMSDFWNKWGKPIFDNLKEAWTTTSELFQTYWNTYLKPIWDTFMDVVDKLWTEHLKPLVANFMDFVGELANGALEIYNQFIAPVVNWFVENFGPPISTAISTVIDVIGDLLGGIIDAVSGIIDALKGVVQFITGVFTGDWKKAWEGIKNIFKGIWNAIKGIVLGVWDAIKSAFSGAGKFFESVWDGIKKAFGSVADWFKDVFTEAWEGVKKVFSTGGKIFSGIKEGISNVFKSVVNKLIDGINTIIATPFNAINGMLNKIRSISIIGLEPFKSLWDENPLSVPQIPKLATGTVVPANYGEFLAVLGDNKREAEVVSPISTIKQALKEVMAESGSRNGKMAHFTFILSNKVLFDGIIEADKEYRAQTGKSVFEY